MMRADIETEVNPIVGSEKQSEELVHYLLSEFVDFAKKNKVPAQWYYISISRPLILPAIKALIARDFIGSHAYYEVYNNYDNNIKKAIEQINKGASKFPIQLDKK